MKNKVFFGSLVVLFFMGMVGGNYVSRTALSSTEKRYAVDVVENKTGKNLTIYVQRFDAKTFQVTTSSGVVYSSPVTKSDTPNSITIALPNNEGKLTLQSSILPWGEPKLILFRSDKYQQTDKNSSVENVKQLKTLNEVHLTGDEDESSEVIHKQLTLNAEQIDKIISEYGAWLSQSQYGKDAVIVRESFDEISDEGEVPKILAFEIKERSFLARVAGNANTNVSALKSGRVYNGTLLGNDMSSSDYSDYQSTATFRLYHLSDVGQRYFTNKSEEYNDLVQTSGSYVNYYSTKVDRNKESFQIVLASDGNVYYSKNYWLDNGKSKEIYQKAPDDMQNALTAILSRYTQEEAQ